MLTFCVNLPERDERRAHSIAEFQHRSEFKFCLYPAIKHSVGSFGLWKTIVNIVTKQNDEKEDYFILCEDDHQFTDYYSAELFLKCIDDAQQQDADILSGGVSWFRTGIRVSDNLFWIERFSGLQFTVIFKKFYKTILDASFINGDAADHKISDLTDKKYVVYPFISVQKEFGYSDVTAANNKQGRVTELFAKSAESFNLLEKVVKFYAFNNLKTLQKGLDFAAIAIPTYIVNLSEGTDRLLHIQKQFADKPEFQVTVIHACKHSINAVGLWYSIRQIASLALENDDDIIIISEDDHEFTKEYSRDVFLKKIIEAHYYGVDFISGGARGFNHAVRVSNNIYWIDSFLSTQFLVVYRSFFQKILEEPFDDTVKPNLMLSSMTSNKMILFPFISFQRDFGYSEVTALHNEQKSLVTDMFIDAEKRLRTIEMVYTALEGNTGMLDK